MSKKVISSTNTRASAEFCKKNMHKPRTNYTSCMNCLKTAFVVLAFILMLHFILVLSGCTDAQKAEKNLTENQTAKPAAPAASPEVPAIPALPAQETPEEAKEAATPAVEESPSETVSTAETPEPAIIPEATVSEEKTPAETVLPEKEEIQRIIINETQAVKLSAAVIDPDGDLVDVKFSEPLNSTGEWLTKVGDAGEYTITVSAFDGKTTTMKKLLLVVRSLNKAPVLGKIKDITVKEGETIELAPLAVDPDGDEVIISFSGWMAGPTKTTGYDDAGEYVITITASDGKLTADQTVKITVLNVNRPPEVFPIADIVATEGDLVQIKVAASDPDKEDKGNVRFTFDPPFNGEGIWQTTIGDAGTKTVKVTVSDGTDKVEKDVNVIIKAKNKQPVIEAIPSMSVNEGEEVKFAVRASDADNDPLKLTISALPAGARFNENTAEFKWTPDYTTVTPADGSKEFTITFTVSDGKEEAKTDAKITVKHINQPPQNLSIDVVIS